MASLALAGKMFWRVWRDATFARKAQLLIERGDLPAAPAAQPVATAKATTVAAPLTPPPPAASAAPRRSDAISLLALLQREARLVDFLKEDISAYSNEQVGAAVRDVHRDAAAVLQRTFALVSAIPELEGNNIEIPARQDAARIHLTGNVGAGKRGTVRHAGWEATQLQLPEWAGSPETARVVAPAEVEI